VAGWFDINGATPPSGTAVVNAAANPNDQAAAANALCATGSAAGIKCAVVAQPGKHDWPFAARAFAAALPWLAGQLDTPGVAAPPLPGPPPTLAPGPPRSAPYLQAAAK
jgi:S-formylglutathione hydrolase FrmB